MKNRIQEKNWVVTLNSLIYFLLAYYSVISLSNAFLLLLAKIYGFSGTLYYYGVILDVKEWQWSNNFIFLMYFLGNAFTLILGFIARKKYRKLRRKSYHYKLYFFWAYIISFTYFFGNLLVGVVFYFGFGAVLESYSVPLIIKIVFGIISVFVLIMIGRNSSWDAIVSLNSYFQEISKSDIFNYLTIQILYPALIGNVIIFLLKIPHHSEFSYYDTYILLCLFIVIISIYLSPNDRLPIKLRKTEGSFKLQITPMIIAIVFIALIRFLLV